MKFLIKLYPAWWRRRYGGELEALLEDSGARGRDMWDLLRGAMQMQISKWSFGIVAVCGIAGVLLAGLVPLSMPYGFYRSTAILKIPAGDRPVDRVNEAAQAALTGNSLRTIVNDQNLYPHERKVMPMEAAVEKMRRAIQIRPAGPGLIAVKFDYYEASAAQQVTRTLAERFANFEVLDPGGPPKNEFVRTRIYHAGLGLLAGLLAGVALALVLRRRAPAAPSNGDSLHVS